MKEGCYSVMWVSTRSGGGLIICQLIVRQTLPSYTYLVVLLEKDISIEEYMDFIDNASQCV